MTKNKGTFINTVLLSWLLVGTLDITAAIVQTLIMGGNPLVLLKFIASGMFGQAAFSGEMLYALIGLIFHYCIALIWTTFFFIVYRKLKVIFRNKILIGVLYGIFIWVIMNLIVLPMANTPDLTPDLTSSLLAMVILIIAIGLPLTFMANKFYGEK